MIINNFHKLFGRSPPYTTCQVNLDTRFFMFGISEAYHSRTRCSSQFHLDIVVIKFHFIFINMCRLRFMRKSGTIAFIRIFLCSFKSMKFTGSRHDQKIAQIAIPTNATHVSKAKSLNSCMMIRISRPIISTGFRIRT